MLNMERRLLHTLAFDLSVDHPHKYIPDLCKFIRGTPRVIGDSLIR
jgi:hypothetical protein